MTDEWGPWIDHDGKGCPCVGEFVEVRVQTCYGVVGKRYVAGEFGIRCRSWDMAYYQEFAQVIRYRIRKPRGLTILESLLENLPEKVDA